MTKHYSFIYSLTNGSCGATRKMNKTEIQLLNEILSMIEIFKTTYDKKLLARIYVNILELAEIYNISEIDFDTLVMNEIIKG